MRRPCTLLAAGWWLVASAALAQRARPPDPPPWPGENLEPIVYQWRELPKDVSGVYMSGPMVHSSGKVYIPVCNYKGPNTLVEYDPRTDTMRAVSRQTSNAVNGGRPGPDGYTLQEDPPGVTRTEPWGHHQIKIHSPLWEGRDGKVYFSTHTGLEQAGQMRTYPGGHWVCYDPSAGATTDLGIARRHEGILWCVLDRPRDVLYGLSWPSGLLVRCRIGEPDVDKRLSLLGATSSYLDSTPRFFAVLANGRVYLPDGATGEVCVWDPAEGKLLRGLGLETPRDAESYDPPPELRDSTRFRNWWMGGAVAPDGMHAFLCSQRSSHLVEIDGGRGRWGAVIDHGRVVPWLPESAYAKGWSPPRPGVGWFSDDGGRLYYLARPARSRTHVMSVEPAGGTIRDHGLIRPDYEAPPAPNADPPRRWYRAASYKGRPGILFIDVAKFPEGKVVGRWGEAKVQVSFADRDGSQQRQTATPVRDGAELQARREGR